MNRAETERQHYMEQWRRLLLWGPGDVLANLRDSLSVLPCIQRGLCAESMRELEGFKQAYLSG